VFVTGATGVLGRRVVPALVAAGHQVTAVARSEAKAADVRAAGASPIHGDLADLVDPAAVRRMIAGHDAVAHLATNIPFGAAAATREAWRTNDSLRREASAALAGAVIELGIDRYVQESITFPYVDGGNGWVTEDHEREYFWGNECVVAAESAAARVTAAGATGVVLRFAMFMAPESAHTQGFLNAARRGQFSVLGDSRAHMSFIHIDDAAAAVAAALGVPPGVYNVAEPDPVRRSAHRKALAAAVGRSRLTTAPGLVERARVEPGASLARSHRISSQRLRDASGWEPTMHCVEHWPDDRS